jgi:hypothetical protein
VERTLESGYTLGDSLRWQVAAFSAGAAAIHFGVISPHIDEWWLFGVFFFVVAWFQAASAVAVVVRPDRRLVIGAAVVNLVVVAIWVWSRTAGLPTGPEAGEPEAVGAHDVLSTVLEALVVLWALAVLRRGIAARQTPRGLGLLTTVVVWVGVVGATALVFFTQTGEPHGH